MLLRTLNIFIASLRAERKDYFQCLPGYIVYLLPQDHDIMTCRQIASPCSTQILFWKAGCSSCSLLLPKCNFLHLVPSECNSVFHIVSSICGNHFEFYSCPPNPCSHIQHSRKLFSYPGH